MNPLIWQVGGIAVLNKNWLANNEHYKITGFSGTPFSGTVGQLSGLGAVGQHNQ